MSAHGEAGARSTMLRVEWLGTRSYDATQTLQRRLRDDVAAGLEPPTLLLLEHQPVITLGRRGEAGDLLVPASHFSSLGIRVHQSERGGKATYHGPGQLVGYLIARVRSIAPSLCQMVDDIEQTLICVSAGLSVETRTDPRQPGVWAGLAKLGFIGLAVHRGVCWHGFALNVAPDLAPFRLIKPCGLSDDVTSIAQCGGRIPPLREVGEYAAIELARRFSLTPSFAELDLAGAPA
ncbi:MAG: lipoyl(octanoyl) transferase [Chloroflexi bacterium]|nr:lipoyl(octanoyl) transferase [Chloroflexota bacterium]